MGQGAHGWGGEEGAWAGGLAEPMARFVGGAPPDAAAAFSGSGQLKVRGPRVT